MVDDEGTSGGIVALKVGRRYTLFTRLFRQVRIAQP